MDHRTDEQLQRFLDGEASDTERMAVQRHIASCGSCRDRLESLESLIAEVSVAMGLLRPPAAVRPAFAALEARAFAARPMLAADSGFAAASGFAAGSARRAAHTSFAAQSALAVADAAVPIRVRRSPAFMATSWLRAAAVVLAVAGVAGAATIVVQRRVAEPAEPGVVQPAGRQARPAPADPQAARSGVSVLPAAGRIVVAVRGAAAGTTIDVGVAESGAASAFVRGDGEGIRFSAHTGRIDVDATGRAITLDVQLPAGATAATVEVDGQIRARKVAGRVRVERGDADVQVRTRSPR